MKEPGDQPEMSCEEARLLMSCLVACDSEARVGHWDAFEVHRMACAECAREYEETKEVLGIVGERWGSLSQETERVLAGGMAVGEGRGEMTVEEWWADLKRRLPELAELEGKQRGGERRHWLGRMGSAAALAACLGMALVVGWGMVSGGWRDGGGGDVVGKGDGGEGYYVELVTASGRQAVRLGEPMMTSEERRELLVGGKHRVVMNRDTESTIGIVGEGADRGYEVKLTKGELYAEVLPWHRFEVRTVNSLLRITGTKFDVRCEGDRTDLVVKGSVRLSRREAPESAVEVVAGQASTVSGRSPPTSPQPVDALAATAWVADVAMRNVIARISPEVEEDLSRVMEAGDRWGAVRLPESLDYGVWREEHRDWFGREFPWVFEAQAALFREGGIDVDYVELMVVSGDAWQFHYDPGFLLLNKPIAVFDEGCMRRVARHFGVDEWWLLEAVGSSRWLGRGSGRGCSAAEYARGLERWREDILGGGPGRGKRTDAMLLFSMRASSYLSHARTAAYLWMREHPEEAERLRGVDGHFGECLLMLGGCLAGGRVDLGGLSGQLTALNRGNEMAQAMLMASPSPSPSCVSELEALWREFGRVLSGMLPEGSEGTEPAKGE